VQLYIVVFNGTSYTSSTTQHDAPAQYLRNSGDGLELADCHIHVVRQMLHYLYVLHPLVYIDWGVSLPSHNTLILLYMISD
jgi:hypothetical protein